MHLAFVFSILPLVLGVVNSSQDGSLSSDIPCDQVTLLMHRLQADSHGAEFCNKVLQGNRGTKTVTRYETVHPPRSTHTVMRGATTVITSTATSFTSTSIFTSTTTSTQTCSPSFNGAKREVLATAALGQPRPSILAACACLASKPKPFTTVTVTRTSTCPAKTIRVTVFSTDTDTTTVYNATTFAVSTPATPVTTTVTSTAIFAATGVAQHTVISNRSTAVFNEYENLDFYGFDAGGCQCDGQSANDTCTIANINYTCQGFTDCQTVCARVNDDAQQAMCLGVTWATNGAGGRGVCYVKARVPTHDLPGCGTIRTDYAVDSAILLFANYSYPDPYPPQ